jgi:hypothetical protein
MTIRSSRRNRSPSIVGCTKLPPWHRPGWRGPEVEKRPTGRTPEWPANAVERVVFRSEDFRRLSPQLRSHLPLVVYFGADGWPLHTPRGAKEFLDQRMQAELHRFPWNTAAWDERTWRREASNFDAFVCHVRQAAIIRCFLESPLAPSTAQLEI